jgi:hypothetical protein
MPETDRPAPDGGIPIELVATVELDGTKYVAAVEGLELETTGNTESAAQNALIQAMRGWLERQDTFGKLAEALGLEYLDEEAEIVLRFRSAGEVRSSAGDD